MGGGPCCVRALTLLNVRSLVKTLIFEIVISSHRVTSSLLHHHKNGQSFQLRGGKLRGGRAGPFILPGGEQHYPNPNFTIVYGGGSCRYGGGPVCVRGTPH